MKTLRRALAGLVAASLLAFGTTGCIRVWWHSAPENDAAPSVSPTPDLRQALLDSTKVFDGGNFAFTLTGGSEDMAGVEDAASNSAAVKALFEIDGEPGTLEFILIDEDLWVRIDYGDKLNRTMGIDAWSDKYLLIDQTRAPDLLDPPGESDESDPASAAALFRTATDVRDTGAGTYRGTVDLGKVTDSMLLDEAMHEALGAAAASIPFEARIDAEGRLVELSISTPAAGEIEARNIKIVYSQFGTATPPRRPTAAQSMRAPDAAYELLTD
ncbi:hypothetical protein [Polymorphospora rubra]|uniref:LppX_LprAFG lipoprotein n=1 Tax=Polymorphospora rubra TaxID=338584 RepID=A0A810N2J5_9ACTN|nr:hypothetical protein [Polymorphospora rubra]BCJ66419.1 hypothetical protein Prubr_34400 [Polymorphospora rubra]